MLEKKAASRQLRSESEWMLVLKDFARSGLSVTDYCHREGLGKSSFHRWQSRLSSRIDRASDIAAPTGRFIDIGPLEPPRQQPPSRLEIKLDLGHGLVLHVVRG